MKTNITKEQVLKAIESDNITFHSSEDSFGDTVCFIGGNWFYCGIEDGKTEKDYSLDELSNMIADSINDADGSGLGDGEAEYYKSCIR